MWKIFTSRSPAGMFTPAHILSIAVCFVLISLAVFFTRKITQKTYFRLLKVFAVIVTLLEIVKICLTLEEGVRGIYAYLPLFFCSLFIYSLWLTCFNNKIIKGFGLSYIAYAAVIAGVAFIIFPTSSFSLYPFLHFKCIHSMLFHSMMVYAGIMLYVTKSYEIKLKTILQYVIFTLTFMLLSVILNNIYGGNFMFVSNPGGIPIPLLTIIFNFSPVLYSIVMIIAHVVAIPFIVYGFAKLIGHIKSKRLSIKNV